MACDPDLTYDYRVMRLMLERGMTHHAAQIVVQASMYGIGCVEGEVRARIETQKKEPLSEDKG